MLKLNLSPDPVWHDLGYGVRVLCRPVTSPVMAAIRQDPEFVLPDGEDEERDLHEEAASFARIVARAVIEDWEGVGDAEGHAKAEVTPENIDALMDVWQISDAFQAQVVAPAFLLEQEKNA